METINLTFGTKPFEASRDVGFSENSLSIGDFWEANKGRLPMLIRVQEGFMGAHWFDEISTGQVYWIASSSTQMRVVAKDDRHGYFSIPVDYPIQLQAVSKGLHLTHQAKSKPCSIKDLLEMHSLPVKVKLARDTQMEFLMTTDRTTKTKFDHLELIKTYEERYLLGNSIVSDKIYVDAICALPVYLPIRVSGSALSGGTGGINRRILMNRLTEISQAIDYRIFPINKDIMIFSQEDVTSSDGVYDYIAPSKLVSYDNIDVKCTEKSKPKLATKPVSKPYEDLKPNKDEAIYEELNTTKMAKMVKTPQSQQKKNWAQIPKDTGTLTVAQVAECLRLLNMQNYVEKFEDNQIDGTLLREMEPEDLQEEFNMNKFKAKKLCLFAKGQWRPDGSS